MRNPCSRFPRTFSLSRRHGPVRIPRRSFVYENLGAVHSCFIGKPRKPCCGQGMKAALVVLAGRHSQQQIVCLPVVPIGKQASKRRPAMSSFVIYRLAAANIYQRTQRVRRSVRSADCGGPGECASDVRSRGIAPARKELRNGSSKSERESTSGRSTNYGSGHLIRVFRDIGRIFSLLFLLSHPLASLRHVIPKREPRPEWPGGRGLGSFSH